MKIEKYKYLNSGRYKVVIDGTEYTIYEDIIISNNLLSLNEITKEELNKLLKDNDYYEAYYKALKYIETKLRTKKEITKYLEKIYDKNIIKKVVEKLEHDGYLNENIYAKAYINDQMNLKMIGPSKIEKELLKLGINSQVIKDNLKAYTEDIELEKINKFIEKEIRLNRNKSSLFLKNKILTNLTEKGFSKKLVYSSLEDIEIDDNDIYQKEYDKLKNKLKEKYKGNELEYQIKMRLYKKGFKKSDIY